MLAWVSAAPTELNSLLSVLTQGSISGFALISPWAMQECRPYRALSASEVKSQLFPYTNISDPMNRNDRKPNR